MRRREFLGVLGSSATGWPFAASAQPSELPRVAAIFNSRSENNEAFRQGLSEAGYIDGQSVVLEERIIGPALDRADEIARELVALKSKVIFAGTPYAIRAAVKATSTIPIVGVDLESDPVASGLVKSNARPGGNFTGFFLDIPDLGGKQIELLIEAVKSISRLAIIWDQSIGSVQYHATETAPRPAGVTLQSLPIQRAEDFGAALEPATHERAQGLVLLSSPLIFLQRQHIADMTLSARMPTISLFTSFPKSGG